MALKLSVPISRAFEPPYLATTLGATGEIVALFLVTRLGVLIAAATATVTVPLLPDAGTWAGGPTGIWPGVLARWDARWYLSIAQSGYKYVAGEQSNVGFAPLFPWLMHIASSAAGRTDVDGVLGAGVIVSNVSFLLALLLLTRIVSRRWGHPVALRTSVCLLLFPTSFFLSAAYAESIFLVVAIGAIAAADEGWWWLAGLLGGLAALARLQGVLIILPLAWLFIQQHKLRIEPSVLWLGLVPMAALSWLGYVFTVSGDPLAPLHSQNASGRQLQLPWDAIAAYFAGQQTPSSLGHFYVDAAFTLLFGLLVLVAWRKLGPSSLAVFATVFYLPIILTGTTESAPRYVLELFPAFIVLGMMTKDRIALTAYVIVGSLGSVLAISRFALGYWIA